MTSMQHVKELLSTGTGTEGQLFIPRKIHDTLIEEVDKNLIPRSEAAIFLGPGDIPGSSVDIDLTTPNSMDVRVVAEGAEIALDQVEYTSTNVKPVKYGVSIRITRELLEDGKWNLLQHNIRYAGKRLAENENSLVVTALDSAANSISGGASVTVPNITRAMQYLRDSDYTPTTYAVGMEVMTDLMNIDLFVDASKSGNTEMLSRGMVGTIFGMNVIAVSTNAGMTTTTSYVYDNMEAYVLAEKRPMTVENFELPTYDMSAAAITQRITAKILRTSAVAKITSS